MNINRQSLIVAVVGTVIAVACLSGEAQAGGFKFNGGGGGGGGNGKFHWNGGNHKWHNWNYNYYKPWYYKPYVYHQPYVYYPPTYQHWNYYQHYAGFCNPQYGGGCNYHDYCFTPTPVVIVQQPALPQFAATGGAPLNIAAGTWTARPANNVSIIVTFESDSRFAWKQTIDGKANDFAGTYSLDNGLLTLNRDDNSQQLIGSVASNGNGFNFKLQNGDAKDPGLAFSRS